MIGLQERIELIKSRIEKALGMLNVHSYSVLIDGEVWRASIMRSEDGKPLTGVGTTADAAIDAALANA